MDAPTKSGVLGLVCCAMGLSRQAAQDRLPKLNELTMAVRIDRSGTRWWDYHTVGAGIGMTTAAGEVKTGAKGTLITRREYLADASFLVAMRGDAALIAELSAALESPKWPVFLGRKSCPPSVPVLARPREGEPWTNPATHENLWAAVKAVPWCPRYDDETPSDEHGRRAGTTEVDAIIEWRAANDEDIAPETAEVWYDAPVCFDPPVHEPRLILRETVSPLVGDAVQQHAPPPSRPRADYKNTEYRKRRAARLEADHGLCVFCKNPASTVQHVTYRRAGGNEAQDDLRALCRLCHDAVTMIEYGHGMGIDRIDPCDVRWRDEILRTRGEILRFRSEEGRRRALRDAPERVRREVLEEEVP
jgi:CRISPR system Cascade subunit CasD